MRGPELMKGLGEETKAYRVLAGKASGRERQPGRLGCRWENTIK
jgi:hypothetical protein